MICSVSIFLINIYHGCPTCPVQWMVYKTLFTLHFLAQTLYVSKYICIHTTVYVCIHIHIFVHWRIYICIYMHMVPWHKCMYAYLYICVCVRMYICICVYISIYVCTYFLASLYNRLILSDSYLITGLIIDPVINNVALSNSLTGDITYIIFIPSCASLRLGSLNLLPNNMLIFSVFSVVVWLVHTALPTSAQCCCLNWPCPADRTLPTW